MTRQEIWDRAVRVWETGSRELARLATSVDPAAVSACVEAIAGCRGRVVTSGAGTSGAAARKIAHSLSCVERPAFFLEPADAVHGGLGAVQSDDVAVLVSKGGGTAEIIRMLPALESKNVLVIGVTENADSEVGRRSDILLRVKVEGEADDFDMLATTSTMAVVAVFDAICIALVTFTGYTREQFAVIHPGGAVGERLTRGKRDGGAN
jgi:D-arabinose 5-phosphate isomerase GutQ